MKDLYFMFVLLFKVFNEWIGIVIGFLMMMVDFNNINLFVIKFFGLKNMMSYVFVY